MKRILFLCIVSIALLGCSADDDPIFFFEFLPANQITNIPDNFVVNQADTLFVSYNRPTSCHGFDGFQVERDETTRNITIITKVIENRGPCNTLENDERSAPLIFRPEEAGEVILNFFSGEDAEGNPMFITLQIPIIG